MKQDDVIRFRAHVLRATLETAQFVMQAMIDAIEDAGSPEFAQNLCATCITNIPCARLSIEECERVLLHLEGA